MKNYEKKLTLNAIDILITKIDEDEKLLSIDLQMISVLLEEYKEILLNNIQSESR